jgi:hypothetical protein
VERVGVGRPTQGEREEREGGRLAGEARESFNGVVAMARARGH